ncbi:hypothetical protein [Dyadobacter sp. NIV53]|nr:hypothetical protein [Dyadobacter sp. NIV53]
MYVLYGSINGVYRYDPSAARRPDTPRTGGNTITDFKSKEGQK